MKMLDIRPQLFKFEKIEKFVDNFNIGENDLIFTTKRVYESFLKDIVVGSKYIFKDDYKFNEPSDDIIDQILLKKSEFNIKRIIAVGGGSIIDIAKILALKNVTSTKLLFERKLDIIKENELIIVPTTCGTGSEVTNISITEIKAKKTKMGLATDELYADYAVLIPELLKSLPHDPFMYSSIDALIHATESYLSPKSNKFTEVFSVDAIRIIIEGYKTLVNKGLEYRNDIIEDFLIASTYAGIAFANTGVGAVHALSYPLSGKYHVAHGEANYQFFTEVLSVYKEKAPMGKLKDLESLFRTFLELGENDDVYSNLELLLDKLIKKKNLKEYGMNEKDIVSFSEIVIDTQQRLLANNYTEIDKFDMIDIYSKLY